MKCEKCGGEWTPPKNISVSLTNCPFCGAPILNVETASSYTNIGDLFKYLVSLYGAELYKNRQKLSNLIADFYRGDERLKRVYRRAILEDTIAQRVYELSLKPLNEREAFCNQIISQFADANFYSNEFGKQVVESFTMGLQLEVISPISTEATEEDGEWVDEFGVTYSADRKKLIKGIFDLENYQIKKGTIVICDKAWLIEDDEGNGPNLSNIFIPNSVTRIGDGAFWGCSSLTSIVISNSVTIIGDNAFRECSSLTSIVIPNSVTSIGYDAFWGCSSLTSISIPNSVTIIWNGAFKHCSFLTSITIPNSVTRIGDGAFWGCSSLTSITIPDSVTQIGSNVFPMHDNFTLQLENNKHFIIQNEILYTANGKILICCFNAKIESIIIPNSVTRIGDGAFWGCSSLTSITIPNSVIIIGNRAFCWCSSLASITIPNSVTIIENRAFCRCTSLTSITIPNSVTSIGDDAFRECFSLTNIAIPNSVTIIGNGAFRSCTSLTSITIPKGTIEKFKRLLHSGYHDKLKEI